MQIGNQGVQIEKYFEGLHDGDLSKIGLQPKMDCSGIWTEGYGHAMVYNGSFLRGSENEELANSLSVIKDESEAIDWLRKDNSTRAAEIESRLKIVLPQSRFDALISMYYNAGYSSSMFAYINKGSVYDDDLIDFWVHHYIRSDGIIRNGLVKRRCCEANLWKTGDVDFEAWKKWYDKLF